MQNEPPKMAFPQSSSIKTAQDSCTGHTSPAGDVTGQHAGEPPVL